MQLKNKKALVIGGAGFIGSHIISELIKRNCKVTVIDDFSNGRMENIQQNLDNITLIKDSVTNSKLVRDNIDVDVIFHEAALNLLRSVQSPSKDLLVNAGGTLNILEAMRETKSNAVLVYASTGSIYGEPEYNPQDEKHPCHPTSPYGISKLAAEQYVNWFAKEYGLKTIALRYYNVFGSRQEYSDMGGVVPIFIKRMLKGLPPIIEGDGTQSRCFTYIDDVTRANILAYEKCKRFGKAYNIGTTEITTIQQLADIVCSMRSDITLKPEYTKPRIGDVHDFGPDISKAKQYLDYSPKWRLKDALPHVMDWMKCELDSL